MSRSPFIRIQRFQKQSWNRPKVLMGPAQIFIARNGDVSFQSHKRTAKLKRKGNPMRLICAWVMITIVLASMHAQENSMPESTATRPQLSWMDASSTKLDRELIGKYGEAQRARLERGLHQVAEFWRPEDGDAAAYEEFVSANFASEQATLDTTFNRFERLLE